MAESTRLPLRTAFMGTPEIAVPTLRLFAARTDVQVVVTQPDRPAGRGQQSQPPPVKRAALELGLSLWQPETLKNQAESAYLQKLDLIVVLAYGELLRQDVLDRPRGGCINLHASLLPRWRGASPLQAVLRAGDAETGVSVMRMVRGLDAGPVFLRESLLLSARTTLPELHDAIAELSAVALGRFLDAYAADPQLPAAPQIEAEVTLCRKLTTDDGHLDFSRSAIELERWVRAFTPAPGCWATVGAERWRILACAVADVVLVPGACVVQDGRLLVGCAENAVEITRLQLPGKRPLSAAEFLNGHRAPERFA